MLPTEISIAFVRDAIKKNKCPSKIKDNFSKWDVF